jgi:hypothetical protein
MLLETEGVAAVEVQVQKVWAEVLELVSQRV